MIKLKPSKSLEMALHSFTPCRTRVDDLQYMTNDQQQQETPCLGMRILPYLLHPSHLSDGRQLRLVNNVPVPETCMVCANVA